MDADLWAGLLRAWVWRAGARVGGVPGGRGGANGGGGAARGLTAAVAAGEAATLGLASLAATGPAAASVKDPGRGWRREARD